MSAQGQTAKDITSLMQVSEDYVRDVIHTFNERGFDALDPNWSRGHPKGLSERVREHIRLIARTSPADWGITGFATRSLAKLADHLTERHVVPRISRETLRRILREGKVSWQTTTTWKASTDPDFIAKMHRILALYDTPPTDCRVICVDEFGPLNLQPRNGKAWRPAGRPRRLRATYNRYVCACGSGSRSCQWPGRGRRACASCSTTSPRTGTPRYAPGPPTTTSSWSSCRPTDPG
ncbi:IS630 family transposase [Streptomyces sp. ME18-1-4]|uniref:IS630 family transposase n=1 Tax=Streptomyces sp. ME18-1-4 TaxID=3028685 RepID=UPI0039F72B6B